MTTTSLWERYLYGRHSREELASWARRLRYFRFRRAYGGHIGDADSFVVSLRVESQAEFEEICQAIDLPLLKIDPQKPLPQAGQKYTPEQYSALENPIGRFPLYRQPGKTHIHGVEVFAWVGVSLKIDLNDPGKPWSVSNAALQSAEALGQVLSSVSAKICDPPQDDRNCICPKYYPEFWHP
jgi:hypothetical protein